MPNNSVADRPPVLATLGADWHRPFRRLDLLLAGAVEEARQRFGADAGHDAFRGLYVTDTLAADVLRHPARPLRDATADRLEPGWGEIAAHHRGWAWLRDTAGLTDTELDVVLIALATEADLRYERLYAYLQDDVSRRRPTVNLILDLIGVAADDRLRHRALFAADAPLLAGHVLSLVPDERTPLPPLLAHAVVLDEQIVTLLLSPGGLDRALSACCRLTRPAPGGWAEAILPDHVMAAGRTGRARVHLHGLAEAERRAAAEALAGRLDRPLLTLRTAHLPAGDESAATTVIRAVREAALHDAVLLVDGLDALPAGSRRRLALAGALAGHDGVTVLTAQNPWTGLGGPPLEVLDIAVDRPGPGLRRAAWAGHVGDDELAAMLAERFSFGPARIAEAVTAAGPAPTAARLFAAARRQTGHRLATLARRIEPVAGWTDLVLPGPTREHLADLCAQVRLRPVVRESWGFAFHGANALFTGPPGTGKTTAAEVIAGDLGLDLFAIDLSAVVSKYIGETEKNLDAIFSAAAETDAILLFDEADALFGKRSEVHDAHDRYANIETSYLLQRMERYEGIAILATNLRQNLDEAFTRRLRFVIEFPFPAEEQRAGIWRVSFPPAAPLAGDLDLGALARDHRMTGAEIRNAALHAAFLAAARGEPISAPLVRLAIGREFQKSGRVPPEVR